MPQQHQAMKAVVIKGSDFIRHDPQAPPQPKAAVHEAADAGDAAKPTHQLDNAPRKRMRDDMTAEGSRDASKRTKKDNKHDKAAATKPSEDVTSKRQPPSTTSSSAPNSKAASKTTPPAKIDSGSQRSIHRPTLIVLQNAIPKKEQYVKASSSAPNPKTNRNAATTPSFDKIVRASASGQYANGEPCSHAYLVRAFDAMRAELKKKQQSMEEMQASFQVLHETMDAERKSHANEMNKTKMDMMLDVELLKKKTEKEKSTLLRENSYETQNARQSNMLVSDLKKRMVQEETDHTVQLSRAKADHQVALDRVNRQLRGQVDETRTLEDREAELEGEIEKLQTLYIEEKEIARKKETSHTLPPAYGSINDDAANPPYQVHEDSGTYDVIVFKRTVRMQFFKRLEQAQARRDVLRNDFTHENEENACKTAHCNFFYDMTEALDEAVRTMKAILAKAEDMCWVHMDRRTRVFVSEAEERSAKQSTARRIFVASHIVKIVIDLGSRLVAACEVYPNAFDEIDIKNDIDVNTRLALMYHEADELVHQALQSSFAASNDKMMFECATLQFQLQHLAKGIEAQANSGALVCFKKGVDWLEGQVQTLRATRAVTMMAKKMPARPVGSASTLNPGVASWGPNLGANGSGGALTAAFTRPEVEMGAEMSSEESGVGSESEGTEGL